MGDTILIVSLKRTPQWGQQYESMGTSPSHFLQVSRQLLVNLVSVITTHINIQYYNPFDINIFSNTVLFNHPSPCAHYNLFTFITIHQYRSSNPVSFLRSSSNKMITYRNKITLMTITMNKDGLYIQCNECFQSK